MRTNEVKIIKSFKGEYDWLSNMYQFTLPNDEIITSAESLFQASKALFLKDGLQDEPLYDVIAMTNPYDARKMGRNIKNLDIKKWNEFKLVIMASILFTKFWDNFDLHLKLLDTDNTYLIEGNNWNDTYWGVCNGKGHNYLGKLLMYIRDVKDKVADIDNFMLLLTEGNKALYDKLMKEYIETVTEKYLDEHYPMPKLNIDIQKFANKENNEASSDVSPSETSSEEVLNINKKEENKMIDKLDFVPKKVQPIIGKVNMHPAYDSIDVINDATLGPVILADLEPEAFKGNSYILNKYFHYKDHSLDRPYLPELDKGTYENYVKNWNFENPDNFKFETASNYFKTKVQKMIIADDLEIRCWSRISFEGYSSNPELFEFRDFDDNQRWLNEEKYIEDMLDPDKKYPTSKELMDNDPYREYDYKDLLDSTYDMLKSLINRRLIMLTNAKSLIHILNSIAKNTDGYITGISKSQKQSIINQVNNINNIINDKNVVDWILQGNDDYTLYVLHGDDSTKKDYIETYQEVLRALTSSKPNENLQEFSWYLPYQNYKDKNLVDKTLNIILENKGLETEYLWDSQSADYNEDIDINLEDNPEYYEDNLLKY